MEWFNVVGVKKVSQQYDVRAFELHVYPKLGQRICDDVNLQEWSDLRGKVYEPLNKGFQTSIPQYININVKKRFGVNIPNWTMHDLRRTMRTHILGLAAPHICEIMLGHGLPQVWGTYDLNEYIEPQAQAYENWFLKLCAILDNYDRFDIRGSISSDSKNPFLSSHKATALIP